MILSVISIYSIEMVYTAAMLVFIRDLRLPPEVKF
uniref:Uncharacterized protein n=1 Tax=Anguilla anguilla TaxID=7936 RepID=A0A0E9QPJ3_ANGAN